MRHGHEVWIESGAGVASGYADADYAALGVKILPDAVAVYGRAQLLLKVKEPVASEYGLLRKDHILFSFLHLAALPELTRQLAATGLTAVAFETVAEGGRLPLLAPMSEIAGRLAVQIGATLLHSYHGGRGLLLGGLSATERGQVTVLGAGEAGGNAAAVAAALGGNVTVLARSRDSLRTHATHRSQRHGVAVLCGNRRAGGVGRGFACRCGADSRRPSAATRQPSARKPDATR